MANSLILCHLKTSENLSEYKMGTLIRNGLNLNGIWDTVRNQGLYHCVKYTRIQVFTDPYSLAEGQNRRFCPNTEDYG